MLFVEKNVFFILLFDDVDGFGYYDEMKNVVFKVFFYFNVVFLFCYIKKSELYGFVIVEGFYVNFLVINNVVYFFFFVN